MANLNRSRKRKLPSSQRTAGRRNRFEMRKLERESSAGVATTLFEGQADQIVEIDGKPIVVDHKLGGFFQ